MTKVILSTAEEMNPTFRSTMEDCHIFHPAGSWGCNDSKMCYVGVYDGHGGRDIVEFLEFNLAKNVAEELNVDDDTVDIETRLERAFLFTDIQSRRNGIMTSGATVAICIFKVEDGKIQIVAANAGDARAVVNRCDKAFRLTNDHRADDPIEQKRIEKAGGFVLKHRVLGILAVARSLGDHSMKEFVICQPFVQTIDIVEEKNTFLIVACDGLWDVMNDQEAVDLVQSAIASNNTMKEHVAQVLVDEAMKRGSSDNITAVVTWIS